MEGATFKRKRAPLIMMWNLFFRKRSGKFQHILRKIFKIYVHNFWKGQPPSHIYESVTVKKNMGKGEP